MMPCNIARVQDKTIPAPAPAPENSRVRFGLEISPSPTPPFHPLTVAPSSSPFLLLPSLHYNPLPHSRNHVETSIHHPREPRHKVGSSSDLYKLLTLQCIISGRYPHPFAPLPPPSPPRTVSCNIARVQNKTIPAPAL
ncbi:hypothetical protein QE152_g38815 [Popillia japonica]|uniref:Uncharacterized protein n=1 Tax=Popillia japonica TaxID=7064 RepID=A0AAW1HVW6_POPJA